MEFAPAFGFDQVYDQERTAYYDPSVYAPLFTQQELSGFEPAQYSLDQSMIADEDMDMAMGCWQEEAASMQKAMGYSPYGDMAQLYANNFYDVGMQFAQTSEFYSPMDCFPEEMAGSCQASPFSDQSRLPFQASSMYPVSPITPSGSPREYGLLNTSTSGFMVVPSNGQYQYGTYQVPMTPLSACAEDFFSQMEYQDNLSQFDSQQTSPYSVPSLTASPLASVASSVEAEEDNDEEEEEEEEVDILPNHGNTELRGMGLYDMPELEYPDSTPSAPITPNDQLRPVLGKGLVLERSFGLPKKMMMKDAESGEIVEGNLDIDDEEDSWSPATFDHDSVSY